MRSDPNVPQAATLLAQCERLVAVLLLVVYSQSHILNSAEAWHLSTILKVLADDKAQRTFGDTPAIRFRHTLSSECLCSPRYPIKDVSSDLIVMRPVKVPRSSRIRELECDW